MRRACGAGAGLAVVMATALGCGREPAAPRRWLYEAPLAPWPRPPEAGVVGRGRTPLALPGAGIVAAAGVTGEPLAVEELIAADSGAAEAVASGMAGGQLIAELIHVDAGVVRWRTEVIAPVRAVTGAVVVTGDGRGTTALDRTTGAVRWTSPAVYRAHDGELIAGGDAGRVVLIDATRGPARPAFDPPGGASDAAVVAVCAAAAPRLYAWRDGELARWDVAGDQLTASWSVPAPRPGRIDACGPTVLVVGGGAGGRVAVALDPATGAVRGGPVAARDLWPARSGDGVELATDDSIEVRDRELAGPRRLEAVHARRLLARRGGRRVVAGDDGGAVLLDGEGARALAAPFGAARVALGDRFVIGGPWAPPARTQAARVARWALPPAGAVAPPAAPMTDPLLGPVARADLPEPVELPDGVALDGAGAWAVAAAFVDPDDPERVYAAVLDERPATGRGAGLAAFDLHSDVWRWHRGDACPPGTPVAMAAAGGVVACGARGTAAGEGRVRAVSRRDGAPAWEWRGDTVDALMGAGGRSGPDAVMVVVAGAGVIVLDAATGVERARWRATDNYVPRIALVRHGGDTLVASLEHGHLVIRSASLELRPVISVRVAGTVVSLFAVGDRAAVVLTDGTLYLVDAHGVAVAAGVLATTWAPAGDLAVATGVDHGDGLVVGVGVDGVPRLAAALAGAGRLAPIGRAASPGAPLVVAAGSGTSRLTALDGDVVRAVVDLPAQPGSSASFATEVHGRGVLGVVLARPLRLVRLDLDGAAPVD